MGIKRCYSAIFPNHDTTGDITTCRFFMEGQVDSYKHTNDKNKPSSMHALRQVVIKIR